MSPSRPALGRAVAAGLLLAALCSGVIASPDTMPVGAPAAAASAPAVMMTAMPDAPKAPAFVEQVRIQTSDMVITALNFLGVPYRRGGASEDEEFCPARAS